MSTPSIILADIGNTHTHLYDGNKVIHLVHDDAIKQYAEKTLHYISVNRLIEEKIITQTNWKNVSALIVLKGAYETMGVDRRALCLSHSDGLFIEAGAASTVDGLRARGYQGGFILPGLAAALRAYSEISPVLDRELNRKVSLESLPLTTKDGISYGIIAPIKAVIEKHQKGKTLYFSGGDGAFLSTLFEGSVFDETLVFQGMRRALKKMRV
jgi:type III pantothenate kinase